MRVSTIKKAGRCFIELPEDLLAVDALELFKLKDGYYLLSLPLGEKQAAPVQRPMQMPSEEEKNVIKKLLAIKFESRTPAYVSKALSARELEVLQEVEKKKYVNVFKGEKYKGGVYNISDTVYGQLYATRTSQTQKSVGNAPATSTPATSTAPAGELLKNGYAIVSEREAVQLMDRYRDAVKRGEIKGIKGFDNNYYIVSSRFLDEASKKVLKALDKDRNAADIAKLAKMEENAVQAVL
ncbi:MAG: hypothetical protein V1492_03680, partial [Candidatus Micrarchaeota archaeon]